MSELHLFEGYGVEIEYMLVDREDLSVRPVADELLKAVSGKYETEVEMGALAWSNELSLHLIELKTNGPVHTLEGLHEAFQNDVRRINDLLAPMNARLMPTAMHPWMDPLVEMRLWPHEYNPVYEQYNKIFTCRGHGWANLQSVHLNLPFSGDEEFGRLHAAIRMALPLIPAIAASSPVMDGKVTGTLDNRLAVYRTHVARVPSLIGDVVPEPLFTRAAYEREILERIYKDLAPHDPEGILRNEWANARGAIARFDRMAVEIRLVDVQECPRADIAVAAALSSVVRALVEERWCSFERQKRWSATALDGVLRRTTDDGLQSWITNRDYLACFGLGVDSYTAGDLWAYLIDALWPENSSERAAFGGAIGTILEHGVLARRIRRALGKEPDRTRLREVYEKLCRCLSEGESFLG